MSALSAVPGLHAAACPAAAAALAATGIGAVCQVASAATSAVGSAASGVVGFGVNSVLSGLGDWVSQGASWLLTQIGTVIGDTTSIDLGASWFSAHYATMAELAARGDRAPAPARDHPVRLPAEPLVVAALGPGQRPPGRAADGRRRPAGAAGTVGHRRHEQRRGPRRRTRQRALHVLGPGRSLGPAGGHRPAVRPGVRGLPRGPGRGGRSRDGVGGAARPGRRRVRGRPLPPAGPGQSGLAGHRPLVPPPGRHPGGPDPGQVRDRLGTEPGRGCPGRRHGIDPGRAGLRPRSGRQLREAGGSPPCSAVRPCSCCRPSPRGRSSASSRSSRRGRWATSRPSAARGAVRSRPRCAAWPTRPCRRRRPGPWPRPGRRWPAASSAAYWAVAVPVGRLVDPVPEAAAVPVAVPVASRGRRWMAGHRLAARTSGRRAPRPPGWEPWSGPEAGFPSIRSIPGRRRWPTARGWPSSSGVSPNRRPGRPTRPDPAPPAGPVHRRVPISSPCPGPRGPTGPPPSVVTDSGSG